jgi:hypothetical protein
MRGWKRSGAGAEQSVVYGRSVSALKKRHKPEYAERTQHQYGDCNDPRFFHFASGSMSSVAPRHVGIRKIRQMTIHSFAGEAYGERTSVPAKSELVSLYG